MPTPAQKTLLIVSIPQLEDDPPRVRVAKQFSYAGEEWFVHRKPVPNPAEKHPGWCVSHSTSMAAGTAIYDTITEAVSKTCAMLDRQGPEHLQIVLARAVDLLSH